MDITFGIWALAVPTLLGRALVNGDGDVARHITMGEHILQHGLIRYDVFSYTRLGDPYFAKEWLSQIWYALFHRLGGVAGVAIGAALVVAATYALGVLFMRRRGVDPLLAFLTGLAAALLGSAHWLARPHLFTLAGVALLMFLIEDGGRRRPWLFAPLFLLWANLHPGFVIGFAILVVCLVGQVLEAAITSNREERSSRLADARYYALGLGIAFLASLANPRGIMLHHYIQADFANPYLTSRTDEWLSPNFHMFHGKLLLAVICAMVLVRATSVRRPPVRRLLLMLFLLASALFARRNIPLFGLVVLPLLAIELDSAWRGLGLRGFNHVRRLFQRIEAVGVPGRWVTVFLVPMLLLLLRQGQIFGVQAVPGDFDEQAFPVRAVDWAKRVGLNGRIFHESTWGGYILYEWPDQKIFIDGMTDFFGEDLTRDYLTIRGVRRGWDRKLEEFDIDLALIGAKSALAYVLERDGWRRLYADATAVILQRNEPID